MTMPIIVVDDDEDDRYIVRRTIEDSGVDAKIHEFESGDQFVEVLDDDAAFRARIGDAQCPALVLLDINMPRMSGFEVLDRIEALYAGGKRDRNCMVVMMYSSSSHAEDRADSLRYDFVKDYIVKSLDEEQFKAIAAKYCG